MTDMHTLNSMRGQGSDFAVVERELIDEDEHFIPRLFITDTHPGLDRQEVKEALDKAGRVFGLDGRRWLNHTILSADKWPENIAELLGDKSIDHISFEDLEVEARGEKRVTLRMERALHAAITNRADENGMSFNDYCISILGAEFVAHDSAPGQVAVMTRPMSQRDAMRALYQVYGGNKKAVVKGWIRLYEEKAVTIGSNPQRNPPAWYAPQLWSDGEKKFWFKDRVSQDVLAFVRSRVAAWEAEDHSTATP